MAKAVEITFAIGATLAGSFAGTFGKAGKALSDFQRQVEQLQKQSGQIESYQKMQGAIVKNAAEMYSMTDQAEALNAQAAASKTRTQDLSSQYRVAQQETSRLNAEKVRNTDAYNAAKLNMESLAKQIKSSSQPTAELQKQYKAAQEEVRRLEGAMKQSSTALKAAQQNAQGLNRQMKESQRETKSLTDRSQELTTNADKLQQTIDRDKESLERMRKELQAAGIDTGNLANEQARLTQQSQRMAEAQAKYQRSKAALDQTKQNLSWNNIKGELMTAAGLGYSLYKPVSQAATFEQAMAKVNAVAFSGAGRDKEADAKAFKALEEQARQLGRDTQFTAVQAAQSQENLARAGFKSNEIIAAMPGLLNMAAAEGMDLSLAADIAASTLRGFKMSADQSNRVADVLAQTSAASNTSIAGLGESMKYVAPVASNLGVSIEQTAAMLGVMANAGIKGTESGTALRNAFLRLSQEPKAVAEALAELGIASRDAQGNMRALPDIMLELSKKMKNMGEADKVKYLGNIFGTRAVSGMMAVMNGVLDGSLEQLHQYNKEATGVLKGVSEVVGVSLDDMRAAMKGLDPFADKLGISFRDLSIYTAMLAESGIKGATANHMLNETFTQILKNSRQVHQGLKKYNISLVGDDGTMREMPELLNDIANAMKGMTDVQQLEELTKIFGQEGAIVIQKLMSEGSFGGFAEASTGVLQVISEAVGASVDDIRAGMKGLDPFADKLGISFRDLSIYTAMLAKSGIKEATANHILTATFSQLAENSKQVQEGLKQYDISLFGDDGKMRKMPDLLNDINNAMKGMTDAQQLEALSKIFGDDAALGIRALMKEVGKGSFIELDRKANSANKGVSAEMAEKLLNTYSGQVTLMQSAIEGLTNDIGNVLLPVSKEMVRTFTGWIGGLSKLAQKYPLVTKTIVGTVGALAALKVGLVGAKIGWNLLKLPFQSARFALDFLNLRLVSNASAIAETGKKAGLLSKVWGGLKSGARGVGSAFKFVSKGIWDAFKGIGNVAFSLGKGLFDVGKLVAYKAKTLAVTAATKAWVGAQKLWGLAMKGAGKLLDVGKLALYYGKQLVITTATKAWAAAQWLWNAAMSANPILLIVAAIGLAIVAGYALYKNWDDIKKWWNSWTIKDVWAVVRDYVKSAKDYVVQKWNEFWNWWDSTSLGDWFKPVKDFALDAYNFIRGKWQELTDWLSSLNPFKDWTPPIVDAETAKAMKADTLQKYGTLDFTPSYMKGDLRKQVPTLPTEQIAQAETEIKAASTASKSTASTQTSTKAKPVQPASEQEIKKQIENVTILNNMSEGFSQRVAEMTAAWQPFKDSLGEGFQQIYTAMQGISDKIHSIVIPAVNELVSALSRVASEITAIVQAGNLEVQVSAPGQVVGGNVPAQVQRTFGGRKRANGGIITKPEIALIGEAGREAIIPLERQSRGAELWLEAGHELGLVSSSPVTTNATASNVNTQAYNVLPEIVNALKFQPEVSNIIPHAEGGIFSQPHIGLVAEAGREAIIPLENQARGIKLWFEAGRELGMLSNDTQDSPLGIPLWKAADESEGLSFGASVANTNTQAVFSPNVNITVNVGESDNEQKYRQMFTEIFEDLIAQFQDKMERVAFE